MLVLVELDGGSGGVPFPTRVRGWVEELLRGVPGELRTVEPSRHNWVYWDHVLNPAVDADGVAIALRRAVRSALRSPSEGVPSDSLFRFRRRLVLPGPRSGERQAAAGVLYLCAPRMDEATDVTAELEEFVAGRIGSSARGIARELGLSPSTVYRMISRRRKGNER